MRFYLILLWLAVSCFACSKKDNKSTGTTATSETTTTIIDTIIIDTLVKKVTVLPFKNLQDSAFVAPMAYQANYKLEIKYATKDNFTNKILYDCANCLLRKVVADALVIAADTLSKQGLGIVLFDCYRPLSVQQKMWELVPNPIYVADPAKGSMHNRGNAVDISLYRLKTGDLLDMGTGFDHFGREAHHAYTELPEKVLANRQILKQTMEQAGFQSITSEWWHYSYNASVFPVSNFPVPCK
jgi:D-alanyl-D-alanine dipeptidase